MENTARRPRALLIPLTILAWTGVLIVAGWLLSHFTHALLILVLGIVVAFAVTPLVKLLSRWMPRTLAIAAAYVVGMTLVLGLLSVVVTTAAGQIVSLVRALPEYGAAAQRLQPALLDLLRPLGVDSAQLSSYRDSAISYLQSIGGRAASDAFGALRGVLDAVIDAVLVLILSVYLTANGPGIQRWIGRQVPSSQGFRARELVEIVNRVVGGYVRGTVTMATLVGMLVGAGMGLLGVRYALLLAVVAFFMEFIPVLGVFISGGLCVGIALFQGWVLALIVAAYFVVIHIIEGDVVGPRVMGRAVGVHPAVSLVALVAASEVFGLWGALFGAPLAGLIQAIVTSIWREVRGENPPPDRAELDRSAPPP
jgi:predicted PurR-regulated permease PerM